ncbi:MAG: hypothetical protein MJ239_07490 [Bacilli bacterium]|nr:hypothetical protein [Bacilli bacterium]
MEIDLKDLWSLAAMIAVKAHKKQKRRNGEPYVNHPLRLRDRFINLLKPYKESDMEMTELLGIPSIGVVDVCLLHDVIEDTDLTMEDIRKLYENKGALEYFDECVKEPLRLITHIKSKPYDVYINKLIKDPVASLVKRLDLEDNLNLCGLDEINEEDIDRSKRYIEYFKRIDDAHHFLDKFASYREWFTARGPKE